MPRHLRISDAGGFEHVVASPGDRRRGVVALGFGLTLCAAPLGYAASATWNGTTNSSWATTTNWSVSPVPGTGDTASFLNGGNTHTTLSFSSITLNAIVFNTSSAAEYTFGSGGETLTLNNGGAITMNASVINNQLFTTSLALGTTTTSATYTLTNDSPSNLLIFDGGISGGTLIGTKTLTVAGAGNTQIVSVIGGGSGTIALDKNGDGTLALGGINTFAGALKVNQGTLSIGAINNVSTAGTLGNSATAVTLGGTLQYTGGSASSSKPFALGTSGTFEIHSDTTELTLSGILSGAAGKLIKTGPGTLSLASASNSYGGGTSVDEGTLKLAGTAGRPGANTGLLSMNGGTFDMNGISATVGSFSGSGTVTNNGAVGATLSCTQGTGVIYTFSGSIVDRTNAPTGTVALSKAGAGMLVLSGNNSYGGATAVTDGMMALDSDTALGSTSVGTTVSAGATLQIYSNHNIPEEPITIFGTGDPAYGSALFGVYEVTYAGLLKLGASATVASLGSFHFTNPGTITGAGFTLTLTGGGEGEIDSIIGTTTGGVTKSDTGRWILRGANTYTGTTTINAGILNIQNANALGASTSNDTSVIAGATLQIEGGITTPAAEGLTIRGAGAAWGGTGALENVSGINTWSGDLTLGADSTISSDSGFLTITNAGTITGAFDLTLSGAGNGSIASVLAITTGTVIKSGNGTWGLTGLNTYTAKTFIQGGILEINTLKSVSGGSSSLGAPTTAANGTIDIGSVAVPGTLRFVGTADASSNRVVNLAGTSGGAILDSSSVTNKRIQFTGNFTATGIGDKALTLAGTSTGNNEITGAIIDSIGSKTSVGKTGSGNWTLTGAKSYTGSTGVDGGTLTLTNAFLADASEVGLSAGGVLNLTFAGSDTVSKIYINGIQQSPGTWGGLSSSATYKTPMITGSGILNVTTGPSQQPYGSWVAGYALNAANGAFNADTDGDGIVNAFEWIFGGSPFINNASLLPQLSSNATQLMLSFTRADGSESSTILRGRWSTDLVNWHNVTIGPSSSGPNADGVTITVTENGTSPDSVKMTVPRSLAGQGRLFVSIWVSM